MSVVPSSLLASDGLLYYARDQSVFAAELREFQLDNMGSKEEKAEWIGIKLVIIGAIDVVNKINIKHDEIIDSAGPVSKFMERINYLAPNLTKL